MFVEFSGQNFTERSGLISRKLTGNRTEAFMVFFTARGLFTVVTCDVI